MGPLGWDLTTDPTPPLFPPFRFADDTIRMESHAFFSMSRVEDRAREKQKHKPRVNRDGASTSARSFSLCLCLGRPGSHVAYACACIGRVNQYAFLAPVPLHLGGKVRGLRAV